MSQQRLNALPQITSTFEPYGWFVAPYIMGSEFDNLDALAKWINANPPTDDAGRRTIEEKIHQELAAVTFSSQIRARSVWLGLQTNHFNEYSHLYETAIFCYYKRNYAAVVPLLLAALEGIILSISGWQLGQPSKPKFEDLKRIVRSIPPYNFNQTLNTAQAHSLNALSNFIDNWLYANSNVADFSLSVLNRHYILHGFEPGNFYRPVDVHRLILAFDLLIDVLSMSQGIFYSIVSNGATGYTEREEYYRVLRQGGLLISQTYPVEARFLAEHPKYVPPV